MLVCVDRVYFFLVDSYTNLSNKKKYILTFLFWKPDLTAIMKVELTGQHRLFFLLKFAV